MLAVLVRLFTFFALDERHQEHATPIKAENQRSSDAWSGSQRVRDWPPLIPLAFMPKL
jgi:hypothetical protein